MFPFYISLKTPGNQEFSGVFREYKMETLAGNGIKFTYGNLHHFNTNFHLYTFIIV